MRPVSLSTDHAIPIGFRALVPTSRPNFLLVAAQLVYHQCGRLLRVIVDEPFDIPQNSSSERNSDSSSDAEFSANTDSPQTSDEPPPAESHQQRLARIKQEIESGQYETPEKLEIAIQRMLGVISHS